ncbi:MAG: hypothetical protein NTU90_08020, partial [Proteobacteria bacterium]|nr:hypothetical protein [Pseudomonadota bacterium]
MKKVFTKSILIFLIYLVAGGCQQKTHRIITGEPVVITTETIGPEGGTITINKEGDPLNGYSITVPSGAYDTSVSFTISYRPILSHTFEKNISFISPLISVENGGDYSRKAMTVKIPVQVPDGHFAMAFIYDDKTGELQGVPMRNSEKNLLTVATKHFTEMAAADGEEPNLEDEVDSKFKQGVDNWQYVNWGSYLAPLGHCGGQSLAALYYYSEKKVKEKKPSLFGLYDDYNNPYQKTPDLQWDDTLAYRLCSMAQVEYNKITDPDIDKEEDISELLSLDDLKDLNDKATFCSLVLSMLVTDMPQLVVVYHVDANKKNTGHALIVYKCVGTELYVSDPNYPSGQNSTNRTIVYNPNTQKFNSYNSGRNAEDALKGATQYETIEYQGSIDAFDKTPLVNLWNEFEAGTVGQDTFPYYSIMVKETYPDGNVAYVDLIDNYETTAEKITVQVDTSDFEPQVTLYKGTPYPPQKGATITGSQTMDIPLNEGVNSLGFHVEGKVKEGEAKGKYSWVGFTWVNVIRKKAASTTTTTTVEATTSSSSSTTIPSNTTTTTTDGTSNRLIWSYDLGGGRHVSHS